MSSRRNADRKRLVSDRILGSTEPRIFTRPLRELTEETSLGFEAIEFAESLLGRPLFPWQRWLFIHSLELALGSFASDPHPRLRFRTVVVEIARQNGKSYWLSTRALWRMVMWESPDGNPPLILGTAHKESAANEVKRLAHKALKNSPALADITGRDHTGNGDSWFEMLDSGARYRIEAATDDGGRSLTVTDLLFDELRQQRDWAAWAAMTNTTNAVYSPQVIAVSNAGEDKSVVLSALRSRAIKEIEVYESRKAAGTLGTYEGSSLFLAEWSAAPDCDLWDRSGWAASNPSLNHPGSNITDEMIAAQTELVGDTGSEGVPESKHRTEVLCQWVPILGEPLFDEDKWMATFDPKSQISESSPIVISADTSHDRRRTWLAVAGWRDDGLPHVEVIAVRAGNEWVVNTLAHRLGFTPAATVIQGRGAPASSLIEFLELEGIKVTRCEGSDLGISFGRFSDRVNSGTLRRGREPSLDIAIRTAATVRFGDVLGLNRQKSADDVSPLMACVQALWGLESLPTDAPFRSAYEDDALMIV